MSSPVQTHGVYEHGIAEDWGQRLETAIDTLEARVGAAIESSAERVGATFDSAVARIDAKLDAIRSQPNKEWLRKLEEMRRKGSSHARTL